MFGFNSKAPEIIKINFLNSVKIEGYEPNPDEYRAYVIQVDRLATTKVIGIKGDSSIEVAIANAAVPAKLQDTLGKRVILVDERTAKALNSWFPWIRDQIKALITMENARIFNHYEVETESNIDGRLVEDAPVYAKDLLEAGRVYGYGPAVKGAHRQNSTIEKSLKSTIKELHKGYMAAEKTAKKAKEKAQEIEADDPFADADAADAKAPVETKVPAKAAG